MQQSTEGSFKRGLGRNFLAYTTYRQGKPILKNLRPVFKVAPRGEL
jgi:hypothetical protein